MYVSWLYFIGNKKNPTETFVYGLSLPTDSSTCINSKPKEIVKLEQGKSLFKAISVSEFEPSQFFEENNIYFNKINSTIIKKTSILEQKKGIIQYKQHFNSSVPESPISSITKLNIGYTNEVFNYGDNFYINQANGKFLLKLLKAIQDDGNQLFTSGYSKRLGCYEFGEIQPWAEKDIPFQVEIEKNTRKKYFFRRSFYNSKNAVHFIAYTTNNEIILDQIKCLDVGESEIEFNLSMPTSNGFEYWVFDEEGNVIHRERSSLIMSIIGNINVLGAPVTVSARKKQITVTPTSSTQIEVNAPYHNKSEKEVFGNTISAIVEDFNMKNDSQRWFSTSDSTTESVAQYLNSIIGTENSEIYFIDPFIGVESIFPILRLNKTKCQIHIISSQRRSIDENSDKNRKIEEEFNETKELLKKIKSIPLATSNLVWHDIGNEKFHDRFIYIKNDTKTRLFSVSNSLNNLLKRYNLSILEFRGGTKHIAEQYIKSLINCCNSENKIYPSA